MGVRDAHEAEPHVAGGASKNHAAWLKRVRNSYALNNRPRGGPNFRADAEVPSVDRLRSADRRHALPRKPA